MKVITINREYGAGGHSIGRQVAKELGIEFYDRDIIKETAKALGIAPEQVEHDEEQITKSNTFIRAITPVSFDYRDSIFEYERDVILKIAGEGPCVILGRCADSILASTEIEHMNVYLYADADHRAERVGDLIGSGSVSEILKEMKKKDQARHAYYTHYTGRPMNECGNWDLALNTGTLGYDACVKIICEAVR